MDLSFGQKEEMHKNILMNHLNVTYFGLDISTNITEACKRFYSINRNTKGVLIRADTSKNKSGECSSIEGIIDKERIHTETMLSIVYGENRPIPKEYETIKKRYFGLCSRGFDVVGTSNFQYDIILPHKGTNF